MNSFRVMAIDLSYRDTGVCVLKKNQETVFMEKAVSYKNPEMGNGFESLKNCASNLNKLFSDLMNVVRTLPPDILIIEMPCFTQSAKSALAIGMLWGLAARFQKAILIEPSALKNWSESKRGDGKEKVKEKVLSRLHLLSSQSSNDNIVDAIGIALLFLDKINELKYETIKRQSDFRAFVLEN